jgi:hypothetical protein
MQTAFEALPPDLRRKWLDKPKMFAHLDALHRQMIAQDGAQTRRLKRRQAGEAEEPVLEALNAARVASKTERLAAALAVAAQFKAAGDRVTSKTVSKALEARGWELQPDTVRKYLRKIRHDDR